jgi:FKBP-type peptidyl-prolyl cis-trans isomerase FkpA/FKBP-type peptidyl-prolyl cis-trans isomerase FklB
MFLDGTVLDSSVERGEPNDFVLNEGMISGFVEGMLLMKEGGKATFIVPSDLGYGDGGGRFSPFATLIFEVELIKVSEAKPAQEFSFE